MDLLKRTFRDVTAGCTAAAVIERRAYIKHLSYADQIEMDAQRQEFYDTARRDGIPTDEEKLAELTKAGRWSDTKERALKTAKGYIADLHEGKRKNLNKPSMVKGYLQKIEEAEKDYQAKFWEKRQMLGLTCELSADREINDYYILKNIFNDSGCRTPLFTPAEFDYFDEVTVGKIVGDYNRAMEGCAEKNLKKLAMQPFFQSYYMLCGESPRDFFGKPIASLSFYQIELLRHAGTFRHIFTHHDTAAFPKHVWEDPDLLIESAAAAAKGKDELQKQGGYEEGAVVLGMKPEDARAMGVKQGKNHTQQIMGKFGGDVIKWAASQSAG